MDILEENKKRLMKVLYVFVIIISLYYVVLIFSEIKKTSMLGESNTPATIVFTGHGEIKSVPDIANVSFNITNSSSNVKDAQNKVSIIEKKALDFLKSSGVADKDIKTISSSFNPKYEYKYDIKIPCIATSLTFCPPPTGKNVIVGYEASESINVKIRNTDDVGKIIQGLGALGVTDLNGPNFSIDNEDVLKASARKLAINDAKTKAQILAKDLGVSLGKVSNFYETNNSPMPYVYGAMAKADVVSNITSAPVISKGENIISSDVSITYEIR